MNNKHNNNNLLHLLMENGLFYKIGHSVLLPAVEENPSNNNNAFHLKMEVNHVLDKNVMKNHVMNSHVHQNKERNLNLYLQ
jgi:hypothetical protein